MNRHDEIGRLEGVAANYHSKALAGPNERYHIHVRDMLIPRDGGTSALELGCGKGLWTRVLAERYERLDIVDGSSALIDTLKSELDGCRASLTFHHGLVEEFIAGTTAEWEHIYMTFLLEHLEDPVGILNTIGKRLAEHGKLFIAVPNALSVHRMVALRMGMIERADELSDNDLKVGHRRIYTPDLLHEQLISAGFGHIDMQTVTLKPLSLGQMDDWQPELIEAFCTSGDLVPDHGAYIIAEAT